MGQAQADLKNREKSPQSKFFDKIQNSVDKIDKKMKQIQVDGIQAVNKIDLTDPGKQILGLDLGLLKLHRTGRSGRPGPWISVFVTKMFI